MPPFVLTSWSAPMKNGRMRSLADFYLQMPMTNDECAGNKRVLLDVIGSNSNANSA